MQTWVFLSGTLLALALANHNDRSQAFAAATISSDQIYAARCADCHGAKLEGAHGPALIATRWQQNGAEEILATRIREGVPSRGMPPWQGTLSEADIRSMAKYIVGQQVNTPASSPEETPRPFETALYKIRVESLVETGLDQPKSLAVLTENLLLVTDSKGLHKINDGELAPDTIQDMPINDGLEEIALHPDNGWFYLTYVCSKACGHEKSHVYTLARGHLRNDRWADHQTLITFGDGEPSYGVSKLAFDHNGHVFLTLSGAEHPGLDPADFEAEIAKPQSLASYRGKVLRVRDDGSIPPDNPFVRQAGALPAIWSYGHRGLSGLAFDRDTQTLWATEHGPWGGDEVNRIKAGANYGWPLVSFGYHYAGKPILAAQGPGFEPPLFHWTPSIGVSNILVYRGTAFAQWQGQLLVGALGARIGRTLYRFELKDGRALLYAYPSDGQGNVLRDGAGNALPRLTHYEEVAPDIGRIRDMRIGPRGLIYLLLEHPDKVVRLTPMASPPPSE